MEEVYDDTQIDDLDIWQKCKQQIPKNWKMRKRKDNPRDLDSFVPGSMVQEHLSKNDKKKAA